MHHKPPPRKPPHWLGAKRERIIHVDMGEIMFLRRDREGHLNVYGYDPAKMLWTRNIAKIGSTDSVLLALGNCAGIIAKNPHREEIAIAHVAMHDIPPDERADFIRKRSDPRFLAAQLAVEMANNPNNPAYSQPEHLLRDAVKNNAQYMQRPGYFADTAVQHIAREMGANPEAHIFGGYSHGSIEPRIISALERLLREKAKSIHIDREHIGGRNGRAVKIAGIDTSTNLVELDIGKAKFFMSIWEMQRFFIGQTLF